MQERKHASPAFPRSYSEGACFRPLEWLCCVVFAGVLGSVLVDVAGLTEYGQGPV
jgi:hypothetical protein